MKNWLDEWIGEKHQIRDRASLDEYTEEKLAEQISHARENSSWYSASLKDVKNFRDLPFLTEEDLRAHGKEMLCVRESEIARVVTTSGTTGRPKRVWFTENDQEHTADYFAHGMQFMTKPGDRALILFPGETQGSLVRLLSDGLGRIGVQTVLSPGSSADCIIGAPEDVLRLSRDGSRSVRTVLLSSAYVDDAVRKEIENNLSCEVFEHYGMTEMGLGCAVSCGEEGYHIRENDIYIEIIDPDTGEVLPDGQWGEITFTSLNREAMPFIRYRTGDMSRILPGKCPCGSFLKRLDRVKERKNGKSD